MSIKAGFTAILSASQHMTSWRGGKPAG